MDGGTHIYRNIYFQIYQIPRGVSAQHTRETDIENNIVEHEIFGGIAACVLAPVCVCKWLTVNPQKSSALCVLYAIHGTIEYAELLRWWWSWNGRGSRTTIGMCGGDGSSLAVNQAVRVVVVTLPEEAHGLRLAGATLAHTNVNVVRGMYT